MSHPVLVCRMMKSRILQRKYQAGNLAGTDVNADHQSTVQGHVILEPISEISLPTLAYSSAHLLRSVDILNNKF